MLFFWVASESLLLSFSLSLVHGSLRQHMHLSVRPAPRVFLPPSPSVHVCLPLPFSRQQLLGCAEVRVWGGSSHFSDQGTVSGGEGAEFALHPGPLSTTAHLPWVPAPSSPPHLAPQPGVSLAGCLGKGKSTVRVVLAVSVSCSTLCFHIYMSRGWAWWHPLKLHLFIL